MFIKRYLFTFIIVLHTVFICAQKHSNLFIDIGIGQGEVLKTNKYVNGNNKFNLPISDYSSADFRVGWQTLGTRQWHQHLLMPYYGAGVHMSYFANNDYFGLPSALYLFCGGPFARRPKHAFNYEFNLGLSYDWKHYDKTTNPLNVAIGSQQTAYIDLRVFYSRYVFKRMELHAGLRATHFSNGATAFPNKGLNIVSPYFNVRYALTQHKIPKEVKPQHGLAPITEYNLMLSIGRRAIEGTKTINSAYATLLDLTFEYQKPVGNIFKWGFAVDLGLDENRNVIINDNDVQKASLTKQFFLGNAVVGQFRVHQFAIQADMGIELIGSGYTSFLKRVYQRMGLRYYVAEKFIAGVRIKARNFSQADYIEWSLGYSF